MNKCVTLTLTTTTLTLTLTTTILTLNAHAGALFLGVRYHRGGISDALCVEWRRTRTPFAVALNTESPWRRFLMNSEWECFAPHKQQWWPYWLLLSIKRNKWVVRTCFMVWTSISVVFWHRYSVKCTCEIQTVWLAELRLYLILYNIILRWGHFVFQGNWLVSRRCFYCSGTGLVVTMGIQHTKNEPLWCHIPWLWAQRPSLTRSLRFIV